MSRIWWCATGPLAFLPIHAAGIYATSTTKAGPALLDFAISSYIPNMRALTERVNSPRVLNERKTTFFMISQLATPNLPPIPGTVKEVLAIKQLLQNHDIQVLSLEGEAAGTGKSASHLRFACELPASNPRIFARNFRVFASNLRVVVVCEYVTYE